MDFIAAFAWEWTQYDFMRMALLAVLLIAPLYGLLGTMVVDGRMAFFSDSLGHSSMTGVALGVLLGLRTPVWAMVAFGVVYALLLTYVKARGGASTDTTIGVFSATGMALGVVLLSRSGGFAKYSGYLIGDLLAIDQGDLAAAAAVLAATLLYWVFVYNPLLLTSVSETLAASRG
ncbi:MAG: metal ABC transporter permease, partial [Firmicutes bacterium]|nr:metal ABC transporter permease [Bacillota bacterium]